MMRSKRNERLDPRNANTFRVVDDLNDHGRDAWVKSDPTLTLHECLE